MKSSEGKFYQTQVLQPYTEREQGDRTRLWHGIARLEYDAVAARSSGHGAFLLSSSLFSICRCARCLVRLFFFLFLLFLLLLLSKRAHPALVLTGRDPKTRLTVLERLVLPSEVDGLTGVVMAPVGAALGEVSGSCGQIGVHGRVLRDPIGQSVFTVLDDAVLR